MEEAQRTKLPFLVIAIAFFEFARAGLILFVALSPMSNYRTDLVPKQTVQVVTMNMFFIPVSANESFLWTGYPPDKSEQKLDLMYNLLLMVPIAVFFAWIGVGLLWRKKWGRGYAVAASVLFVLFWLRGLAFTWPFDHSSIGNPYSMISAQTWQSIYMALTLNAIICLYLVYGNGVAEAFGEKKKDPPPNFDEGSGAGY